MTNKQILRDLLNLLYPEESKNLKHIWVEEGYHDEMTDEWVPDSILTHKGYPKSFYFTFSQFSDYSYDILHENPFQYYKDEFIKAIIDEFEDPYSSKFWEPIIKTTLFTIYGPTQYQHDIINNL